MRRAWLAALLLLGTASAQLVVSGQQVHFVDEGRVVWQQTFPPALGRVVRPVSLGNNEYLGVGPVVFAFDRQGRVLGRADLPGQVTSFESGAGMVRVTGQGYERLTLTLPGEEGDTPFGVEERVVFPPDPLVTGWLAHFAASVPEEDVQATARRFPLNPFLALREARTAMQEGDFAGAKAAVCRSLSGPLPFPVWTALAAQLDAAGFPDAADIALKRAKQDAAVRGLDPAVPMSRAALGAYGNPSGYVDTLLEQNRLARADVWLNFLRELYPRFEGGDLLFSRYADILDAQGRSGEAEEWRQFTRSLRGGTLYNLGPRDTLRLRDAARLASFALLLALAAALVTLTAKGWKAQGEDLRPLGGRYRSWRQPLERLRLNTLSYASFGERLMLLTLCAALLSALAGWQWANQTGRALQAPALGVGTYGGGWGQAQLGAGNLDTLRQRPGPATYFLSGLAAQLDGDLAQARSLYIRAGNDACAINNLGVIAQTRDDAPQARSLYQRALTLQPDLSAAAYNLGRNPSTPELAFQRTYRPGEPRLCYPDRRTLARTVSSDAGEVLRQVVTDPLGFLSGHRPNSPLAWVMFATLLGLGGLLVLLLIPRAGTAQTRVQPLRSQALALLLPGTGFLGNAWGGVLLVTWASVLIGLLAYARPSLFATFPAFQSLAVRNTLLSVLLGLYGLNILIFGLSRAAAYRRRRAE